MKTVLFMLLTARAAFPSEICKNALQDGQLNALVDVYESFIATALKKKTSDEPDAESILSLPSVQEMLASRQWLTPEWGPLLTARVLYQMQFKKSWVNSRK